MVKYLQINVNRSAAATDLAWQTATKIGAGALFASEPNKKRTQGEKWAADDRGDATIGFVNPGYRATDIGKGNGFVWASIKGIYMYSCYISPNSGMETFIQFCEELAEDIRKKRAAQVVVTGDFNAKAPMWGSEIEDNRGRALATTFSSLALTPINKDGEHTFVRGSSKSIIDITAVSEGLMEAIADWRVLEDEEPLSPHRYITFEIKETEEKRNSERWVYGPIDKDRIAEHIRRNIDASTERTSSKLVEILQEAYKTTNKVKTKNGRIPYWWNAEIGELRKATLIHRRALTRLHGRGDANDQTIEEARERLRIAKRSLAKAVKVSKRACWEKTVGELENDPYGDAYKIVMRSERITHPCLQLTREKIEEITEELFPYAPTNEWGEREKTATSPFTSAELVTAIKKLKIGRAPGPDRLPAEVVKIAAEVAENYVLEVFNGLLESRSFPKIWKTARLVLIEKPRKGQGAVSYRPLCLLDSVCKLYELMINGRLSEEIERHGGLAEQQYGFRVGRSTTDAVNKVLDIARKANRALPNSRRCAIAMIDVKNAFNTANWENIILALERKGISESLISLIKDYLKDRKIITDGKRTKDVHMGVPQGSVLGPTLWNIMYDEILRLEVPDGVVLIGYADDLAIVASGRDYDDMSGKLEATTRRASEWLEQNKLAMAPQKTELIELGYGRRRKPIYLEVEGVRIEGCVSVRYLGVTLDGAVSFGPHVRAAAIKAEKTVKALSRLMPNMGGPGERRRRILGEVANSIMLYGAEVWALAMTVATYRKVLQSTQRKMAIRVIRAYRTTSFEAATVLASMMPIHIRAEERRAINASNLPGKEAKRIERTRAMTRWQEEWEQSTNRSWTRVLIRNIREWVERKHGETSYFLTQAMTGHGNFMAYLHRIRRAESDQCETCREPDTAEHTLFVCRRWNRHREEAERRLSATISSETMVPLMLKDITSWEAIDNMITIILREKNV